MIITLKIKKEGKGNNEYQTFSIPSLLPLWLRKRAIRKKNKLLSEKDLSSLLQVYQGGNKSIDRYIKFYGKYQIAISEE